MIQLITQNILSFILILSIIVFIHEFGHYYIAKLCGVKIEQFSIGFGKELFGFNDKSGTRWKFCLLPFGGYVKMFGDANPASMADNKKLQKISAKEKKQSFYFQNVYKRIAIVSAGPIANFILTILIFTVIFRINGLNTATSNIGEVVKNSAAYEAGIKPGDTIKKINNKEINNFSQIRQIVTTNIGDPLNIEIIRDQKAIKFTITPKISVSKDAFGGEIKIPMLGVTSGEIKNKKLNSAQSFYYATTETYNGSIQILKAISELITGKRSVKELSGPVRIAEYSGKSMSMGLMMVLWFMAMISLNLGVLNLLPLPVLDGGHLLYYIIEAIRGKALPEKVQMFGFQLGFSLIIMLMLFTTYNDISQIILR